MISFPRLCAAVAVSAVIAALATPTWAERADRAKPMQIDANHQNLDDLNQVSVFTGDVSVTKGTLHLTGDRVEYREDPEGYQYAIVTVAPGKRATFRERRDSKDPGIEETIGGEADRIEYDGKLDSVRLISNAIVKRYENGVEHDEIRGALIVYDGINSTYDVRSNSGESIDGGDPRVHSVIAPRTPPGTNPPAPAPSLAPAAPPDAQTPKK